MPIIDSEERQIQIVETELLRRYGDALGRERVCQEVERAAAELYAHARVRTYVPVLVQRKANDRLRHVA
jgi:hypothetical protein